MFTKRLFWRLFLLILLILWPSFFAIAWLFTTSTRELFLERAEADLMARASLIEPSSREAFTASDPGPYDALCKDLGARTATRFTLIRPSGRVIADSAEVPAHMENHADRPEIRDALRSGKGVSTRVSATLGKTLMYVAKSVVAEDRLLGVVRASVPIDAIDETRNRFYWRAAGGAAAISGLAAMLSLWMSHRMSRSLQEIYRSAEKLARGEVDGKLPISSTRELGGLADAMNQVALGVDARLRAARDQSRQQDAILSNITEAVVIVDNEEKLVQANRAARRILNLADTTSAGRAASELTDNPGFRQLITRTLNSSKISVVDLLLKSDRERFVEARGIPLQDTFGRTTGALIVMNDRTRLQKLETQRRDFASNVSHELKTPLTAVRGFADTLLQGALEDPDQAEHFVRSIADQATRLQRLIEELMELARLEREAESQEIERSWHHLSSILQAAMAAQVHDEQAAPANIELDCPEDLTLRVNATLVERAVANLIDNALRYSASGGPIEVSAREDGEWVVISVKDDGVGISSEHREHIFERFYRVASSRPRHPTGVGLGLSIVKHIVLAHGGETEVLSDPGEGTLFRILLPRY